MNPQVATAAFLEGYRLARLGELHPAPGALIELLTARGLERAPFAFEGAAMAWRLRDARDVGPSRVEALLRTAGPEWHPFVRLGVGCALARLGLAAPEDPTVQDGYGFQLGLDSGVSGSRTRSLKPHFERGRGRALWFVTGGDARACARAIEGPGHRGELWRGIGTACTFAGDPLGEAGLLPPLAGVYATDLRRGSEVAMRLWASLGDPPARVLRAAASLARAG